MDSDSMDGDTDEKRPALGTTNTPSRPLPRICTDPENEVHRDLPPSEDPAVQQNHSSTPAAAASTSSGRIFSTLSEEYKSLRPPPLSFDPWTKRNNILICILGLLFFDLALPCLIYYPLYALTSLDEEDVLGIACASLGIGEMMELPLRGWRLVKHCEEFAPLGQESRWGFDFFFWWYVVATVIGIVPYVMATDLDYAIEWLFLIAPGLIVAFAVLTAVVSAVPFRLPFRVSSDAKGERCKPFTYYVIEDFVAVDASQKRGYRAELKARYEASHIFRQMIWEINMWWAFGGIIFIGALSGVTWGMPFPVAYGVSYGLLFIWVGIWSFATWLWVRRALRLERDWFLNPENGSKHEANRDSIMV